MGTYSCKWRLRVVDDGIVRDGAMIELALIASHGVNGSRQLQWLVNPVMVGDDGVI